MFNAVHRKAKLWITLFVVTIVISVATALPTYPQVPSTREGMVLEIKKAADRHVETGSSMQTSAVQRQFEKNKFGLTISDITKIYEEEFLRLKKKKEADPWEKVTPNVGWIAAALIGLWAIFRDTINGWAKTLTDRFFKAIYNRFAGNQLFWGVALRKYREALIGKYRELKIPFRRDRPLKMQDVYVPLKVEGDQSRELIDAYQAVTQFKQLMVIGRPGSGKSMLLKYLTLSWAEGRLVELPGQPIAVLLELYRLSEGSEILPLLVKALGRDDFPHSEHFLEQNLERGNVLLLLDGLDEVSSAARSQVVQKLKDFLDQYDRCRVVITCRSQVYQGEFSDRVDRTLEVVEFTDQQMRRFLKAWSMPPEKSIDHLMQTLRDRPRILELARNPLLLTIITYLYCDTPFVLPHSRAEFYQKSTDILLETWDQARQTPNVYKMREKRLVLRHLALFMQAKRETDRRSLDFQTVLAQVGSVLPSINLEGEHTQPLLKEIIERSGLLLEIDGGERYQFAHLTLQEFFVAEQLRDNVEEIWGWFEQDEVAWREPAKLWCGLVGDSTVLIERIYQRNAIAAFECLADEQKVNETLADQIIAQFKGRLGETTEGEAIVQAFAAVAANTDSRRGQAVFQFLEETLGDCDAMGETTGQQDRRVAAAQALSLTNLIAAVQVLANHYTPEVRQPLIRMGDLAVPELKRLAELGNENALDDLMQIGTPGAARALVPFLWHSDPELSGRATWHLATLLPQTDIEDALKEVPLEQGQQDERGLLSWVWEPFYRATYLVESNNRYGYGYTSGRAVLTSSLSIVTGRIAYLMQETPVPMSLQPLRFDPRLVIPVCTIALPPPEIPLKNWRSQSDALLEQQTITPDIERLINREVRHLLGDVRYVLGNEARSHWRKLFSSLEPQLQLEVLRRLIHQRRPDSGDWQRLFKRMTYRFKTGWHYRAVLGCALLLSAVALVEMFYLPFQFPKYWAAWLFGLNGLVIIDFWIFLWRGIEERLAPDLFVNFGLFGIATFFVELRRLYTKSLVWVGIKPFSKILTSNKAGVFAVGGVFAGASTLAVGGSGVFANKEIFTDAVTSTSILSLAFGIAVASAIGTDIIVVFAVAFTVFSLSALAIAFATAGALAVNVAFTSVVAVAGIGFWYRAKTNIDSRRFFAALALPFFCWLPITATYATIAFLQVLSGGQVVLLWSAILLICTMLWFRGQQLDRQARNPLQGIKALEKYSPTHLS